MSNWRLQGIRFAIVGLASNIALFLLYLVLTTDGIDPKLAMTGLFALGTIQTFIFNKSWTFSHQGFLRSSFWKYVVVYWCGYLLNLTALLILVDSLGYPHQVVQGVMIISLALMLFLLQKFWVFRETTQAATRA